ncbi:MAG TPA: DUF6356 family protein [Allosphingosinicella sp.]|jgi:hypothetical protein
MIDESRQHLDEAGETYLEHLYFALTVALLTLGAGLACVIHAFIPALCQRTCSQTIARLQSLFADRSKLCLVQADRQAVLTFVGLLALSGCTAGWLVALNGLNVASGVLSALSLSIPAAFLLSDTELAAAD